MSVTQIFLAVVLSSVLTESICAKEIKIGFRGKVLPSPECKEKILFQDLKVSVIELSQLADGRVMSSKVSKDGLFEIFNRIPFMDYKLRVHHPYRQDRYLEEQIVKATDPTNFFEIKVGCTGVEVPRNRR